MCQTLHFSITDWLGISVGVLITLITIILNAIVLLSILFVSSLRKPHNLLLFSLAISDFLVGLLVMPMLVYMRVYCAHWPMTVTMCDIWVSLDVMCCCASIFNMTAIAIDRYIATTYPLKYRVHATSAKTIIGGICAWIAAAATTVPEIFAFGNQHFDPEDLTASRCHASDNPKAHVITTIVGFYIPLLITTYAYGKVMTVIIEKKQNNAKNRACTSSDVRSGSARATDSKESHSGIAQHTKQNQDAISKLQATPRLNGSRFRKFTGFIRSMYHEHKGTAILGSLLLAFILCWGPFFTVMFIEALWKLTSGHDLVLAPGWLGECILWLGYANSTLNPFIVCLLFKDFRRAFKELVCCRCFRISQTMREKTYTNQIQSATKQSISV